MLLCQFPGHWARRNLNPEQAAAEWIQTQYAWACVIQSRTVYYTTGAASDRTLFARVCDKPINNSLDTHSSQPADGHAFPRLICDVVKIETLNDLFLAHVWLQIDLVAKNEEWHFLQLWVLEQCMQLLAGKRQALTLRHAQVTSQLVGLERAKQQCARGGV